MNAGAKFAGAWGPFVSNLPWPERLARLRSLRSIVKLRLGPRGHEANVALLRVEISGAEPDLLEAASAEFDRLAPLDRRHVLASFSEINFERSRP